MIPVALFDLDNTLVDRQGAFERWAEGFVAEQGLPGTALEFLIEVDEGGFATRAQVFGSTRARYRLAESVDTLIASYRATYMDYFEPDPEVNEALARLRAHGWRVGVVTNGPPTQQLKIDRAGLTGLIDAACISDVVGVAKPDRRIFDEALRQCLGSTPALGAVWMVGDSAAPDIAGGLGAGFSTIWMHRGRAWEHPDYGPDAMAVTIGEAVDVMLAGPQPTPG